MPRIPFEELPEAKFNRQMQPVADQIYHHAFGPSLKIERLSHSRGAPPHPLDKDWAIDVILRQVSGLTVTIQEKFRQFQFYKRYNQFTIEYENNPETHEPGEFFHLIANYYFYGFATSNRQSFISWGIIDLNRFKECYQRRIIIQDGIAYNVAKSKASFIYFGWGKLRDKGLIFRDSNLL